MRWPNGIHDRTSLRHDPCHFVDLVPTVLELAGARTTDGAPAGAPPVAGRSLVPAFDKNGGAPRDFLYFNHNSNRALRSGDWKLISTGTGYPKRAEWRDWELYDLGRDRSEMVNLAPSHLERVRQMEARWKQIDEDFTNRRESAAASSKRLMPRRGGPEPAAPRRNQ